MSKKQYTRRSDGRYQSQIYLGTKDGKRQYKTVYGGTVRELEKNIQDVKLRLGKGLDVSAERDTFGYWGDKWLKLKKTVVSAGRYTTYKARYANLSPIYGANITKLKTADIQDIILDLATEPQERTGKPYAKYTLSEIKMVAVQVLRLAIENRVIDYNCAQAVKIPKAAEKSTRRALTDEEQRWVTDTPHRAQTSAMIMMYAGLRRGELIPLQWSDIDLSAKTITVARFVEITSNQAKLKNYGKTDSAKRVVYIPDVLVEYLAAQSRNGFLVCPSAKGNMLSNTAWRRMWDSYLSVLNFEHGNFDKLVNGKKPKSRFQPGGVPMVIEPFTAHCLRHTFITMMYLAGVDVMTAKEQAGHKDISTTLKIYTHLDKQFKSKNIEKFNEHINANIRKAT